MTELKMIIEDSNLFSIEQILKNEKDFSDNQFQNELDLYINEYIKNFNKENFKDGIFFFFNEAATTDIYTY